MLNIPHAISARYSAQDPPSCLVLEPVNAELCRIVPDIRRTVLTIAPFHSSAVTRPCPRDDQGRIGKGFEVNEERFLNFPQINEQPHDTLCKPSRTYPCATYVPQKSKHMTFPRRPKDTC